MLQQQSTLKPALSSFSLENFPLWVKLELFIALVVRKCLSITSSTQYFADLEKEVLISEEYVDITDCLTGHS